jgi:hypothetical protein
VARIISSLLAAGILQMRDVQGKSGWFWLFLIEGLLTFTIGVIVCLPYAWSPFFYMHPDTNAYPEFILSPKIPNKQRKRPVP